MNYSVSWFLKLKMRVRRINLLASIVTLINNIFSLGILSIRNISFVRRLLIGDNNTTFNYFHFTWQIAANWNALKSVLRKLLKMPGSPIRQYIDKRRISSMTRVQLSKVATTQRSTGSKVFKNLSGDTKSIYDVQLMSNWLKETIFTSKPTAKQ